MVFRAADPNMLNNRKCNDHAEMMNQVIKGMKDPNHPSESVKEQWRKLHGKAPRTSVGMAPSS